MAYVEESKFIKAGKRLDGTVITQEERDRIQDEIIASSVGAICELLTVNANQFSLDVDNGWYVTSDITVNVNGNIIKVESANGKVIDADISGNKIKIYHDKSETIQVKVYYI